MRNRRTTKYRLSLFLLCTALAACDGSNNNENGSSPNTASANQSTDSSTKITDPRGDYVLRSDAAITLPPAPNITIGDGTLIEVGYDGSKGTGLAYQLFYVRADGSVRSITNASFDDLGGGKFSRDIVVFDADADGRPGFIELSTMLIPDGVTVEQKVSNAKFITLGMYPVRYRVKQ